MIAELPSRSRYLTITGAALLIGLLAGFAAPVPPRQSIVGIDARLPSPTVGLEHARTAFPYEIKLPSFLPEGFVLHHVIETTPIEPEERAYSIDIWYQADDGRSFHIWQTDHDQLAEAGKDPTLTGSPLSIGAVQWRLDSGMSETVSTLSRRFG